MATPHDHRAGFGHDVDYTLTGSGRAFLDRLGVRVPGGRRPVRYCVDWSEQHHHLSGTLGRGLLDRFLEFGWIERSGDSRAVHLTQAGHRGVGQAFGVTLRPSPGS